jgi:hypothetical protein
VKESTQESTTVKAVVARMTGKMKEFSTRDIKYVWTKGSRYDQSSIYGSLADNTKIRIPVQVLLRLLQDPKLDISFQAHLGREYWIVD